MDKTITIGGNFTGTVNFAMQQNYVPVIRNLVVNNESGDALKGLELKITFDPEFAVEYTYGIAEIAAGGSVEISPVRIHLKTEYLFSLTEKLAGNIIIEVYEGTQRLCSQVEEISLLACDQWSGLLYMPEMIGAFVTPNHPEIAKVTADASAILEKWTGSPSFTGYQTKNPNHVKFQMAAVFRALQDRHIVYNNPPASYEAVGQRVRLPHRVLEEKLGTCLDLTLLYASCLEAVGLFPLIVFIQGHAFAGCWLEEESFADCAVDDVSSLEKRTASGAEEILLVECTDFVAGKQVDFDRACKHGKNHLSDPEQFECAVDVQRSRAGAIRPIPLRLETENSKEIYYGNGDSGEASSRNDSHTGSAETVGGQGYEPPSKLDVSLLGKTAKESGPVTKLQIWERKLLDFSLRNSLLNFRPTKGAVQLMSADLGELEDGLSDGADYRIMEAPSEWTVSLRDVRMFEIETQKDLIETIASQELRNGRIRTFLDEKELDKTLKNLYRLARTSMEENGSNTLFLALGFLRWFETDLSEKARYAPIVLIPVDIVRNVRNRGYVIRSRQEDAQVNITLIEYLRQDHGVSITGLDHLPEDEHGIDLKLVFNTVRQAVMGKKRWNVEEMAFAGLFSFGQFVMWNDLRSRSEELSKNKVVDSLIQGRMTWQPRELSADLDRMDETLPVKDMAVPVSADSSQMAAIAAAAEGQSFVLHGPPGTGKSQTITNMIANALFQGKSVLFVAEKMAALSVVQRRLAQIGLDPFCLELHSNKTNKSAVLAQLNKALEVGRIKSPQEYEAAAAKVHELRKKLNEIMDALHCGRTFGCSLYEAIETFERNLSFKGVLTFPQDLLGAADRETVESWKELLRAYAVAADEIGIYAQHPLLGCDTLTYSIELRERFVKSVTELMARNAEAVRAFDSLCEVLGLSKRDRTTLEAALKAGDAAMMPGEVLTELILCADFEGVHKRMMSLVGTGKEYRDTAAFVDERFDSSVSAYRAHEARLKWKEAGNSWFLPKLIRQNKLVKQLRLYAKSPSDVTRENMDLLYDKLCALEDEKRKISEAPDALTGLCNGLFMGLETDWDALEEAVGKAQRIYDACRMLDKEDKRTAAGRMERISAGGDDENKCSILSEYLERLNNFVTEFAISSLPDGRNGDYLREVNDRLSVFRDHAGELRSMTEFNRADKALREAGLICVSDVFREGRLEAGNLQEAFSCGLYYQLALMTIEEDERLSDFHGKKYDDLIKQYHESIDRYQRLTIQELAAKLSARVPVSGTASASSSEMGILKRAIKSNGRMMSLRRLFDQIPTLLGRLCPCMLMSPISVAQYIDPSFPKFDLVIFDEASQLPTSEAVGTIARGENVVVVGDPKQLPPTSFFSSNRIDEENSEKEDLESLLDDCLAISMPQKYLKWHYRSRHESLIAYSNMKYYDNRLYTFPSPRDLVSQVKLVHVDGVYDKGKTKQNRAEAEAIVKEIIRRLMDEKLREDSIGVVTFSSVQQNLIEDLLLEEFNKHPQLDEADRSSKEPVFIKNLENVQGDERDVILFSVGYGPDAQGNVSMNFGPLNRDGGWRRLNVAISRARKQMIVYAVIRPDQINLARTRSEGVAGLKGFLEFAQRGKNVLAQNAGLEKTREDYLILEIAEALKELGYEVRCNIGSSQYKVDMGIVNPRDPETYLLGILLDGENCRAAATARDRFVLQPGVLEGLGWSVLRIWTLDWLDDPEYVLEQIRRAVQKALDEQERSQDGKEGRTAGNILPAVCPEFERVEEEPESSALRGYQTAELLSLGTAEQFYLPGSAGRIAAAAETILMKEAPISRKALMRRVLDGWGISRGGSRVESIFLDAVRSVDKLETRDGEQIFYWRADQNPEEYGIYRVEDPNGARRSMDEIPSQEIQTAAAEVLAQQIGLSQSDLIRETAKKFGFTRVGSVIENAAGYAIAKALEKGRFERLENGNIVLRE